MATAAATAELPIRFKMSVALSCVQTMISLPVFGIFNVYTDVDARDVVDDGGFRKDTPVGGITRQLVVVCIVIRLLRSFIHQVSRLGKCLERQ